MPVTKRQRCLHWQGACASASSFSVYGQYCQQFSLDYLPCNLMMHNFCLQKSDVTSTLRLLRRCATYYHSGELTAECLDNPRPCGRVPRECITHNAVFTILHYLTDHQFMSPSNVSPCMLACLSCTILWKLAAKADFGQVVSQPRSLYIKSHRDWT